MKYNKVFLIVCFVTVFLSCIGICTGCVKEEVNDNCNNNTEVEPLVIKCDEYEDEVYNGKIVISDEYVGETIYEGAFIIDFDKDGKLCVEATSEAREKYLNQK